jgi:hypothetical protein
MKSTRTTAAVAAGGLLVSAIVAGSPASAGEPPPTGTITVVPFSAGAGVDRQFSGEGCVSDNGPGVVHETVFFSPADFVREELPGMVTVDDDGHWIVGFIPNSFIPNAEAVGTWEVTATCFDAVTDEVLVDYETATFEVTAPPTPPSTTPPSTTPPTSAPETPEAPPAAPVQAPPAFTG